MTAVGILWLVPLVRAFRLFIDTSVVHAETQSINAWNDYAFSRELLVSYSFCLLIAALLAWLLLRTRIWWLGFPLAASFLIAFDVIRLKPESVIVLISPMEPLRPAAFSIVAALVAVLILWLKRHARCPSISSNPPEVP